MLRLQQATIDKCRVLGQTLRSGIELHRRTCQRLPPKTSVLPGRRFTIPSNVSHQLSQWLPSASSRAVRHRPFSLREDTAAQVRLPRDYCGRVV